MYMDKYYVRGGRRLSGEIFIPSAKNSVLPIIACSILSREDIEIRNCPRLSDIERMTDIITRLGGRAELKDGTLYINNRDLSCGSVSAELTGSIRSSIFILGPILGRFGKASVSYPGGCEIGLRPIDLHIAGLKSLGVRVREQGGMIDCEAARITGGTVHLDFPSVGATENIMMAAVLAKGRTVITNAAREPEIVDLQGFINRLGGRVHGAGGGVIVIDGVDALGGGRYAPIADRIVAGTLLCAGAVTGGDVTVTNMYAETLGALTGKLNAAGCTVLSYDDRIRVVAPGRLKAVGKIETQPYPGFPTDMQPQFTALLCTADGTGIVCENLFENRFKYTVQLNKLGADITVRDRTAVVRGVPRLAGAPVTAEDLRGGAALVVAALAAEGETEVSGVKHIERGYERLDEILASLGADIRGLTAANT